MNPLTWTEPILAILDQPRSLYHGDLSSILLPKIGFKHVTITENNILIWEKGKLLEGVEGIFAAAETDDYVTFETGSGSYRFQWRKTR